MITKHMTLSMLPPTSQTNRAILHPTLPESAEQGAQSGGNNCRCALMLLAEPCRALSPFIFSLPPRPKVKCHTSTEVPEDIIALFREGDLVHGVSDVASLQQIAGIFAGLTAVRKAFHVVIQPVHHIRTCHQMSELNTRKRKALKQMATKLVKSIKKGLHSQWFNL